MAAQGCHRSFLCKKNTAPSNKAVNQLHSDKNYYARNNQSIADKLFFADFFLEDKMA